MELSMANYLVNIQIDTVAQDCSNSIANALEFLGSCTKPSMLWL